MEPGHTWKFLRTDTLCMLACEIDVVGCLVRSASSAGSLATEPMTFVPGVVLVPVDEAMTEFMLVSRSHIEQLGKM